MLQRSEIRDSLEFRGERPWSNLLVRASCQLLFFSVVHADVVSRVNTALSMRLSPERQNLVNRMKEKVLMRTTHVLDKSAKYLQVFMAINEVIGRTRAVRVVY